MEKHESLIEWDVLEDEVEWRRVQVDSPESMTKGQLVATKGLHQERRLVAVVIVLLLLLASGWVWHRQFKQAALVSGLQAAIASEAKSAPRAGEASAPLPSSRPPPIAGRKGQPNTLAGTSPQAFSDVAQPEPKIISYSRWGDQLMAQMSVGYLSPQGEEVVYRETRFYRKAEGGWLRIAPVPDLLGSWQSLETAHFAIRYWPVDAKAVAEAAPRLERLYATMRSDFALPQVSTRPKITIELADAYEPAVETILAPGAAIPTIKVPSPTLLQIPTELADAGVFEQAALFSLTSLVVQEVTEQNPSLWHPGIFSRQPALTALRLWELWEHGGPLAQGQDEVVRWLYRNSNDSQVETQRALPEEYESLCRLYRVWNLSPRAFAMPLDCTALDQNPRIYPSLPLQLTTDTSYVQLIGNGASAVPVARTVALETVIAYVVKTYGRAHLPLLVQAFGKYEDWRSLIPALFGTSVEEFERGWQTYLAHEYQ